MKSKIENSLLVISNLAVVFQAIALANIISFLLVYAVLLITVLITGRDIVFKQVDFTKDDEEIAVDTANMLFKVGSVTTFVMLVTTMDTLTLLFFLPPWGRPVPGP